MALDVLFSSIRSTLQQTRHLWKSNRCWWRSDSDVMSEADPGIFDSGGSKLWFRKDCWTLLRQITSPPHTPYPHSPSHRPRLHVIIPCRLTVYLDSTCKGCTLGTSSSCVWLQRLYRFRRHQCQGHDVSAWVQVLTTAHQTSCFWDMTWFVASQRMNAQLRQNLQEGYNQ